MKILEMFIALSLFNMLLFYFLKNRKEREEYNQWLNAQEEEETDDQEKE